MTFGKQEYIILGVLTTVILALYLTKKYWLKVIPPKLPPGAKQNPGNVENSPTGWVNGIWVGEGDPPIHGVEGDEVADMIDALYTAINKIPANSDETKALLKLANRFNDYATKRLANEYKSKYGDKLYDDIDGEWSLGDEGKVFLARLKSLHLQ